MVVLEPDTLTHFLQALCKQCPRKKEAADRREGGQQRPEACWAGPSCEFSLGHMGLPGPNLGLNQPE